MQIDIQEYLLELTKVISNINESELEEIVNSIWKTYQKDNQIFFIGNGGSASTATHLAADIGQNSVVNHKDSQEQRFRTICLNDNTAWITAVSNDQSYSKIFVEQLKNLSNPGDLLFIISGSGNSQNLLEAVLWAQKYGLKTSALLGFDGGHLQNLVDYHLTVDSEDYGIIEGVHSCVHHYIVDELKARKRSNE